MMRKTETQHNHAQNPPAQRQGGSAALESPQGEQIAQLEAMANASPQAGRLAQLAAMTNSSPRMAAQRKVISAIHNSPNVTAQRYQLDRLVGEAAQREETEEPLQPKVTQRETAPAKPNNTGLPDNLKSGIESLSGMSMDSVKVHYNSSQPAQLNALAYAQGTDIHVAPGQEEHLPHEAWHVVQQAQGRVKPTMQMKEGVPVNDDVSLEREADVMGGEAAAVGAVQGKSIKPDFLGSYGVRKPKNAGGYAASTCLQRKMVDADKPEEKLQSKGDTNMKLRYRAAKAALLDHHAVKRWESILDQRLVGKDEVQAKLQEDIDGEGITAEIKFTAGERDPSWPSQKPTPVIATPLFPYTFVVDSVSKMEPTPEKFEVVDPGNATVHKRTVNNKRKHIPQNLGEKPVGYVVNLASYYGEKGVSTIAPAYYSDAIGGTNEVRGNRLAIVAGLNSFEPVTWSAYKTAVNKLDSAVSSFQMPGFDANVSAFGFLWQPKWHYAGKPISIDKLRLGLSHYGDDSPITQSFLKRQDGYKGYLPYGIFRETVTASPETKEFVGKLSSYNDPVYIHSGDGDSINLKIPEGDGPELSDEGVLDRYSEALSGMDHNPMLAIGGYNFFRINEQTVKSEIVKADPAITDYREIVEGSTVIDKKKEIALDKLKQDDALFVNERCRQIVHNTQVVNRWDHLIRGAIAKVYPKMLYPTEPNMLIKAHDSKANFDLFSHDKFEGDGTLKDEFRGTLWGNSASEGRALRENLETMYAEEATETGLGFVEWIEQASLPTDTRGFARHFLVSGYERYPDNLDEAKWPPVYHPPTEEKRNKPIPLVEAAAQQAQSYTSAARLTDMYCRAAGVDKDSGEGLSVRQAFGEIETITKSLMSGNTVDISLVKGEGVPGEIVFKIKQDFLDRFSVD